MSYCVILNFFLFSKKSIKFLGAGIQICMVSPFINTYMCLFFNQNFLRILHVKGVWKMKTYIFLCQYRPCFICRIYGAIWVIFIYLSVKLRCLRSFLYTCIHVHVCLIQFVHNSFSVSFSMPSYVLKYMIMNFTNYGFHIRKNEIC